MAGIFIRNKKSNSPWTKTSHMRQFDDLRFSFGIQGTCPNLSPSIFRSVMCFHYVLKCPSNLCSVLKMFQSILQVWREGPFFLSPTKVVNNKYEDRTKMRAWITSDKSDKSDGSSQVQSSQVKSSQVKSIHVK